MASKKTNGSWMARVRTKDGGRVTHVFKTQEAAETWEIKARAAVKAGDPIPDPNPNKMTLAEFTETAVPYVWGDSKNLARVKQQAKLVVDLLGPDRDIASFTQSDLVRIRKTLMARGLSSSTLNNYAAIANGIFRHAAECSLIADAPRMTYAKAQKGRVRYLTDAEEAAIIGHLRHWGRNDYAALTEFLIWSGARISEARNLRREDIEFRKEGLPLRCTLWDTKDGLFRTIPLCTKAAEALCEGFETWGKYDRPFPVPYSTYKQYLDKAVVAAGLSVDADDPDKVTPHVFRHTYGTRLAKRGVSPAKIQKLLGHKTLSTSMIYVNLTDDDVSDAVAVLENA